MPFGYHCNTDEETLVYIWVEDQKFSDSGSLSQQQVARNILTFSSTFFNCFLVVVASLFPYNALPVAPAILLVPSLPSLPVPSCQRGGRWCFIGAAEEEEAGDIQLEGKGEKQGRENRGESQRHIGWRGALEKGKAGSKTGSKQGREMRQRKTGGTLTVIQAGRKTGKKMPRKDKGERRQFIEEWIQDYEGK